MSHGLTYIIASLVAVIILLGFIVTGLLISLRRLEGYKDEKKKEGKSL
jgi:hypothetical protein